MAGRAKKPDAVRPQSAYVNGRFWLLHELRRVRAFIRHGGKAEKERKELQKGLGALRDQRA